MRLKAGSLSTYHSRLIQKGLRETTQPARKRLTSRALSEQPMKKRASNTRARSSLGKLQALRQLLWQLLRRFLSLELRGRRLSVAARAR